MITNMKKFILFSFLALAMSLFCASCIHEGDLELEKVPTIDFKLSKVDGFQYSLTNITEGASNVKWAILSFVGSQKTVVCEGTGDTWTFTFPKVGVYWIQMTATYDGAEETIYVSKLIDKNSPIKLDDDSFDDWNSITRADFILKGKNISLPEEEREGKVAFIDGKFDYDGDFIYIFFRVQPGYTDVPMGPMDGGDDGNEFIAFIDADGDSGTTSSCMGDEGFEFGAEFNFWGGEGFACFIDTSEGWDEWSQSDKYGPAFKYGTSKEEGGYWCFEMAFDRAMLGATKQAFGLQLQITSDWDTCDYLVLDDMEDTAYFSLTSED